MSGKGSGGIAEKIEKIADEMLDEKTTCSQSDFKICPMLSIFGHRIKEIVMEYGDVHEEDSVKMLEYRVASLRTALGKIVLAMDSHKGEFNTLGYVFRTANNAILSDSVTSDKEQGN